MSWSDHQTSDLSYCHDILPLVDDITYITLHVVPRGGMGIFGVVVRLALNLN